MIGVFDSGVGGLTILSQIRTQLLQTPLIYLADHAFAPYGDLTHSRVITRSKTITQWMIGQGCTLVVVACNTATAIAIDELRASFSVPIVGVEPGIKPAAIQSRTQKIGILATENTVASSRYKKLLERFLPDVEIVSQGCMGLADGIEKNSAEVNDMLHRYCQPLVEQGVDQIVLGCTHYPLVKDQLINIVGAHINIVDTSEAIALEVKRRYECDVNRGNSKSRVQLHTTGSAEKFSKTISGYKTLSWLSEVSVAETQV